MLDNITSRKPLPGSTTSNSLNTSQRPSAKARVSDERRRPAFAVPPRTAHELLRIVRAAQPIPRVAVARRLGVKRSIVTALVKPLLDSGVLREAAPERTIVPRRGRP